MNIRFISIFYELFQLEGLKMTVNKYVNTCFVYSQNYFDVVIKFAQVIVASFAIYTVVNVN